MVLTCVAPARTAARLLAVARPRSSWACISSSRLVCRRKRREHVMGAERLQDRRRCRRSENAAPRPPRPFRSREAGNRCPRARSPHRPRRLPAPRRALAAPGPPICRRTQARSRSSLWRICWSETGVDRSTMCTPRSRQARRSSSRIRHQTSSRAWTPAAAQRGCSPAPPAPCSECRLPAPEPRRHRGRGRSPPFRRSVKATPADCSPSRSVVSSSTAVLEPAEWPACRGFMIRSSTKGRAERCGAAACLRTQANVGAKALFGISRRAVVLPVRRQRPQFREDGRHHLDDALDFVHRVVTRQRETHGAVSRRVGNAHRPHDVRRFERTRCAGRPARRRDAFLVQLQQDRFALDILERDVGRVGQAVARGRR